MATPVITINKLISAINNRKIDELQLAAKLNGVKMKKPMKKAAL